MQVNGNTCEEIALNAGTAGASEVDDGSLERHLEEFMHRMGLTLDRMTEDYSDCPDSQHAEPMPVSEETPAIDTSVAETSGTETVSNSCAMQCVEIEQGLATTVKDSTDDGATSGTTIRATSTPPEQASQIQAWRTLSNSITREAIEEHSRSKRKYLQVRRSVVIVALLAVGAGLLFLSYHPLG